MNDTLSIQGLAIETRIGIHAWEQKINQLLKIDIDITTQFREVNDDINKTIDYDALCQHVTELVSSQSFRLIETVAETVILSLKSTFGIQAIRVRVSKPHAIGNAENISVCLVRD